MRLFTEDEKRMVDVGTGSIWYSIYSTAMIFLSEEFRNGIPLAMDFLKNGECSAENAAVTKKQLIKVINVFSSVEPDKAVYDFHQPDVAPPWAGNIAPTVTSCADLYTTADGKDLFTEILILLEYATDNKVSILAG